VAVRAFAGFQDAATAMPRSRWSLLPAISPQDFALLAATAGLGLAIVAGVRWMRGGEQYTGKGLHTGCFIPFNANQAAVMPSFTHARHVAFTMQLRADEGAGTTMTLLLLLAPPSLSWRPRLLAARAAGRPCLRYVHLPGGALAAQARR
jgi:hypothetical protein